MDTERLDRNIQFFGEEGQRLIREQSCAIVGVGGLGTHLVQQLSLLGVGKLYLVDPEELDRTNGNRYIGVRYDDPVPGLKKVNLGERLAKSIDPSIEVIKVPDSFISEAGFSAIQAADFVFGCLDSEGARLILVEACSAYCRPYFDLATEIVAGDPPDYGGRLCVSIDGNGCLICMDVLDKQEAGHDLGGEIEARNREAIYGVPREALGRSGPSVVSLNGIIASLAVTEFMVTVTGLRQPQRLLTYNGRTGKVTASIDAPLPDCWYCKGIYGQREKANLERHLRSGLSERLR